MKQHYSENYIDYFYPVYTMHCVIIAVLVFANRELVHMLQCVNTLHVGSYSVCRITHHTLCITVNICYAWSDKVIVGHNFTILSKYNPMHSHCKHRDKLIDFLIEICMSVYITANFTV